MMVGGAAVAKICM